MRFTVVVPTYRRPGQLAECVRALRALEPPPGGFEIVLVNDGGPPIAPELAKARAGHAALLRVVAQAHAGPAAARNIGARLAEGECLAFTDDDCRPDAGWLRALDRALRRAPTALVGGNTVNALAENSYSAASHSLVSFVTAYFAGGDAGRFFASNNLGVARRDFLAAGGFDERFPFAAEDRDLAHRWSAAARPSIGAPDAVVYHAHSLSLATFTRQHLLYGRGAWHFRQRVRAQSGRAPRVSPGFYVGSLLHPFRSGESHPARLTALVALAHAAYAVGLAVGWACARVGPRMGERASARAVGHPHSP